MLPVEFSTPRLDEQGRTYVIHEPTGVRYFVREKQHPLGKVTTYARNPEPPPKRRKQHADGYARATFIEGSEPK